MMVWVRLWRYWRDGHDPAFPKSKPTFESIEAELRRLNGNEQGNSGGRRVRRRRYTRAR